MPVQRHLGFSFHCSSLHFDFIPSVRDRECQTHQDLRQVALQYKRAASWPKYSAFSVNAYHKGTSPHPRIDYTVYGVL